jgi:hypothetical protein
MKELKSMVPVWWMNISVITVTSVTETLNLLEQVLKIMLILLTAYFTYRIGMKKLQEKKEKDNDVKPL